ncbi:integrase domain-containing protein [Francisella sp. SYW-9]|uniref:integrase domain-containing protein n=1 Tax=Francisella sp. SYW-9 TaxID=2610888 RepID=UPI00123D6AF2|nr:integrase domain-containing protein [Francisella sp. SYW-9]
MSNTKFKRARHSIIQFVKHSVNDKSYATQNSMRERLCKSAKDLHTLGYKIMNIKNIQSKHIEALTKYWMDQGLSVGSIKNRLSDFRLLANKIERPGIIKEHNKDYGIPNRSYVPTQNKAITEIYLDKFTDKYLRTSIELQKEFGLRREECLKIIPSKALHIDSYGNSYLTLDAAWTKGGVGRTIKIEKQSQLDAINKAIELVSNKSLIPTDKTYIQQRKLYDRVTRLQGYYNLHGLRHAYAQKRYNEITGWASPIAGGPARKNLTKEQKILDKQARIWISQELGHSRAEITKNYIG